MRESVSASEHVIGGIVSPSSFWRPYPSPNFAAEDHRVRTTREGDSR
jgi:hypothetical protein